MNGPSDRELEGAFEMSLFQKTVTDTRRSKSVCIWAVMSARSGIFTRLQSMNEGKKCRHLSLTPGERHSGCRSKFRVCESFVLLLRSLSSGTESSSYIIPRCDEIGWVREWRSIEAGGRI